MVLLIASPAGHGSGERSSKPAPVAARVLPARQIERLIETVENLEQAGDP